MSKPLRLGEVECMGMGMEEMIGHVEEAIARSLRGQAYLDEAAYGIRGFSTPTQRRLISNLTHYEGCVYTEAGLFGGGSFCAAMNNNPFVRAVGIEDYSQNFSDLGIREHLEENIARYRGDAKECVILEQDFFAASLEAAQGTTVFNYDAVHSYEAQRDALPHMWPYLADRFLYLVDDFHWAEVSNGVRDGLKILGGDLRVEREWELSGAKRQDDEVWWNGVYVALISKVKGASG